MHPHMHLQMCPQMHRPIRAGRVRAFSLAAALAAVSATAAPPSALSQTIPSSAEPSTGRGAGGPPVVDFGLKRLPADRDGLTFRGEGDARSFAVFLTRQEADKTGEFRLSLVNAVSVQPDRSSLRVVVNGRQLATVPVRSPGRPSTVTVRVPPGVLVPGFNAVSIAAALTHRVDCSIKATYELWVSLNPAETGFVVPAAAASSVRSVADVGAEPLAADGTTHIHVRLADHPDPEMVNRTSHLVDRLVSEAHILRPVVDVGPDAGAGPGLDVAIGRPGASGDLDNARVLQRRPDLSLLRDGETGRLLVVGGGEDGGEPKGEVAGDPSGLAVLARAGGRAINGSERISFNDLGLPDDAFAGRHYLRSIRLRLPADFYPGSYDKARILLDGAYAGDLDEQSSLVFRVNGALVSTLKIRSGTPGRFQHETVELPLQFFHSGSNEVAIEGALNTLADAACIPDVKPEAERLFIGGSSEIDFPHLAHLATMPQIAGALYVGAATSAETHDAYLLHDGPDAIGSALTIAANLAAEGRDGAALRVHFGPPGMNDRPGIVLGASDELPAHLGHAVERLTAPRAASPIGDADALTPHRAPPMWREKVETFFRRRGFFFAAAPDTARRLPVGDRTLLVASVRRDEDDLSVAGIDLPRFTGEGRQWLVFTGRTPAVSAVGIERLVADGLWPTLNGEAVALNVDDGRFASVDPAKSSYVVPSTLRVADLRPIMGGLMSSNIALTAAGAILLMALLGLTTHRLLRTDQRRPK